MAAGRGSFTRRQQTELPGLGELERRLKLLPGLVAQKVLQGALRAGAKVVLKEVERRVPVSPGPVRLRGGGTRQPGLLKSSLRVKKIRLRPKSKIAALFVVGPNVRKAPHAHLVEFGTAGGVKPQRFLQLSFAAASRPALAVVQQRTRKGIEREAKRLGSRGKA